MSSPEDNFLPIKRPPSPNLEVSLPKKKHKRSKEAILRREEKRWSKDSVTLQLDSVVGSFAFGKMSGAALREQLSVNFPSGSTNLTQAPPARRYNIIAQEQIDSSQQTQTRSCYRKFAKVIPVHTAERLKTLFREMVLKGLKHSEKDFDRNRASASRAWHFGIWEKYTKRPQLTADNRDQNEAVSILLKEFLTIISTETAPQVARLYEKYYPDEWKTQQMAWGRVQSILKKKLLKHPYLDFAGAFFAIAVKEGSSDIDHLDWTDGLDNITFVTAVDEWVGGDFQSVELGMRFPLAQGDIAAGKMRKMVHSAREVTSGSRIALTFFTPLLLTKRGQSWYETKEKASKRKAKK